MKSYVLVFIGLIFITSSCKKDTTENSDINTYYFKGILYDSLTGNILPGHTVYVTNTNPMIFSSSTLQTNQNGEFNGSESWSPNAHKGYTPPSMANVVCVSAYQGTVAGFHRFTYGDLSLSATLQTNIYLVPLGYLNIHLIDSSHVPTATFNCTSLVETNTSWSNNFSNNGYDTTILFKAFSNSIIDFNLTYYNNGIWNTKYGSTFINSNDTATKTITF